MGGFLIFRGEQLCLANKSILYLVYCDFTFKTPRPCFLSILECIINSSLSCPCTHNQRIYQLPLPLSEGFTILRRSTLRIEQEPADLGRQHPAAVRQLDAAHAVIVHVLREDANRVPALEDERHGLLVKLGMALERQDAAGPVHAVDAAARGAADAVDARGQHRDGVAVGLMHVLGMVSMVQGGRGRCKREIKTHNRRHAEKLLTRRTQINPRHRILPAAGADLDATAKRARDNLVAEADAHNRLARVFEKVCEVVDEGNDPRRVVECRVLLFAVSVPRSLSFLCLGEPSRAGRGGGVRTAPRNH